MRQFCRLILRSSCVLTLFVSAGPTISNTRAADWPQFLGPDRTGISQETGLIDQWPEGGPSERWRVDGGVGMSGIVISDGTACTLIQTSGKQQVLALNAETGAVQWSTPIASEYRNGQGDGPRGTPAIVDGSVIAFTGDGRP